MTPDQEARFRANTNKGPHVGIPTRYCKKCKQPKPIKGGKITFDKITKRTKFVCAGCRVNG